jgi:hypothetical protein
MSGKWHPVRTTGRRPGGAVPCFRSSNPLSLQGARPEPPALDAARIPPAVRRLVKRALEKNPEARYASGGELASTLASVSHAVAPQRASNRRWLYVAIDAKGAKRAIKVAQRCSPDDLRLSVVVVAELRYGADHSRRRRANHARIDALIEEIETLDIDLRAASAYGRVRAQLEAGGTPIGPNVRPRGRADRGRRQEAMDPLEWLARISDHVPDPGQQRTIFYGEYSSRARAGCQPLEPDATSTTADHPPARRRCPPSWARLIAKVYQVDPLVCTRCGRRMSILAFVSDQHSISRILEHLGLRSPELDRPPPAREIREIARVAEQGEGWGVHHSRGTALPPMASFARSAALGHPTASTGPAAVASTHRPLGPQSPSARIRLTSRASNAHRFTVRLRPFRGEPREVSRRPVA